MLKNRVPVVSIIAPPIDILPNDVLLRIFQLILMSCSQSMPQIPHQMVLGAVSTHWRGLIWHAPYLWTPFSMKVTDKTLLNVSDLLQICAQNRRGLSGSVELDLDDIRASDQRQALEVLGTYLFLLDGASELRSLNLHSPPIYWLRALRRRCSALRSLSLSFIRPKGPFSGFGGIRLSVQWRKELRVAFPWNTLTQLNLRHVPLGVCYDLLRGCPDLTHFTSDDALPSPEVYRDRIPEQGPIVIPKLEYLRWDPWDRSLRFIAFPLLRCIGVLEGATIPQPSLTALCQYLSRATHVNNLEFKSAYLAPMSHRMKPILKSNPELRQLTCINLLPLSLGTLCRLLKDTTAFPFFRVLRCTYTKTTDIPPGHPFIESFYDMIKKRKEDGEREFCFEMDNVTMDWSSLKEDRFVRLKEDGFDLKITYNECNFDL